MYHFWLVYLEFGVFAGLIMGLVVTAFGYLLYWQTLKAGIFNSYLIHVGIDLGEVIMMYFQKVALISVTLYTIV
jgi:hypothetical protein